MYHNPYDPEGENERVSVADEGFVCTVVAVVLAIVAIGFFVGFIKGL